MANRRAGRSAGAGTRRTASSSAPSASAGATHGAGMTSTTRGPAAVAPMYRKPEAPPTGARNLSSTASAPAPARSAPAATQPQAQQVQPQAQQVQPQAQQVQQPQPGLVQQPAATQAPVPATGGGSMMGGFMANVASTAAGVVAGRAIDRAFFGGGSSSAPAEPATPAPQQPLPSTDAGYNATPAQGSCGFELAEFQKCLGANNNDGSLCQWNYDQLLNCQKMASENGRQYA
mmetsp:Transcript_17026/g.35356  ORF Transcript_17026/g.35356 Transcript_17026/m.35356 type:complete len:232 (+) Transcript_17026:2167-2862(+)